MKTLLLCLLFTFLNSSYANDFFIQAENFNKQSVPVCQENHDKILLVYKAQLASESLRLLNGIEQERNSASDYQLKNYFSLLADLLITQAVIDIMRTKLPLLSTEHFGLKKGREKIFDTNQIYLQANATLPQLLKNASIDQKVEFQKYVLKVLKRELLSFLKKEAVSGIKKLMFRNVVASTNGVLLAFTSKALMATAKGALITIIPELLKGQRLPPETLWLDILKENPEFIINPEWLIDIKFGDLAWTTHCMTMMRKGKAMENRLNNFIRGEEDRFIERINRIEEEKFPEERQIHVEEQDATRVAPHYLYIQKPPTPRWALR